MRTLSDTEALNRIHECLNGVEWSAETLAAIAALVEATGRPIAPPPAVAAIPAVRSSGRIFVQAGTFVVPENAQRVRARIAALGSVEIVRTASNGTNLYRVRLGPVASQSEAGRLLSRVVGSGYPGARVIAE